MKEAAEAIDSAALTEAIRTLGAEWVSSGRVPCIRSIGDGHCYEFARGVMDRLGVGEHGAGWLPEDSRGRLIDCVTEDWWRRILDDDGSDAGEADAFVADIARLRREGAPLPDGIEDDDEEFAARLGSMTYNWLVLDCRHYDATCPEGADHFLSMPFFADQIAGWLEERSAMEIAA
jgi:hypothetical protein